MREGNLLVDVSEINKKLLFITWNDIFDIHIELNLNGKFQQKIEELAELRDRNQDESGILLVE